MNAQALSKHFSTAPSSFFLVNIVRTRKFARLPRTIEKMFPKNFAIPFDLQVGLSLHLIHPLRLLLFFFERIPRVVARRRARLAGGKGR